MKNIQFYNAKGTSFALEDVISSIKKFIEENKNAQYKLTIGTDSEIKNGGNKKTLLLITAIVIHRKGYGGKYFWTKTNIDNVKSLRSKIYSEVLLSVETAKNIIPRLKEKLNGNSNSYDLEIHIDVGEKGETRDMIKEVIGIVTGNGYVAKTKPESFAASNVADRHL